MVCAKPRGAITTVPEPTCQVNAFGSQLFALYEVLFGLACFAGACCAGAPGWVVPA